MLYTTLYACLSLLSSSAELSISFIYLIIYDQLSFLRSKSKIFSLQKRPPIQLQPPLNLSFGLTTPFSKNTGPISHEHPGNTSSNGGLGILNGLGYFNLLAENNQKSLTNFKVVIKKNNQWKIWGQDLGEEGNAMQARRKWNAISERNWKSWKKITANLDFNYP